MRTTAFAHGHHHHHQDDRRQKQARIRPQDDDDDGDDDPEQKQARTRPHSRADHQSWADTWRNGLSHFLLCTQWFTAHCTVAHKYWLEIFAQKDTLNTAWLHNCIQSHFRLCTHWFTEHTAQAHTKMFSSTPHTAMFFTMHTLKRLQIMLKTLQFAHSKSNPPHDVHGRSFRSLRFTHRDSNWILYSTVSCKR